MKMFLSTLTAGMFALASAAVAQPASTDQSQPASPPGAMSSPGQPDDSSAAQGPGMAGQGAAGQAPSAAASGLDSSATADQAPTAPSGLEQIRQGNNTLVTNGPVPDTAANRAKYGGPMSTTGKRTKPAGN